MRELIEIFPGRWIEVTKRIKQNAGVSLSARVKATLANGVIDAAAVEIARKGNVKYSRLLLDEAVALAKVKGLNAAARITGVNKWSIIGRQKELRGPTGRDGTRYTLAQKRALVRLAQSLMGNGQTKVISCGKGLRSRRTVPLWNHHDAFIEAGRQLGMNGYSIEFQWTNGQFVLDEPSTPPHPPGSQATG